MRFVRSAIRKAIGELPQPHFALEVGCGSGDVIAELRAVNLNVHGIDISSTAVDSVNRRFKDDSDASAEVVDLQSWQPTEAHFDLITSITVLQHIDDSFLPDVLRHLRSGLAPDGRMLVLETAPVIASTTAKMQTGVNERSATEWENIFESAGLEIIRQQTYAPFGQFAIQKIERIVGSITGASTESTTQTTGSNPGFKRRILSALFRVSRSSILALCWPFDYVLQLNMPESKANYRLYELKSTSSGNDQQAALSELSVGAG
jgi:ubiquinone/menaquinone biosynthesis C-methylase UbiE